MNAHDLPHGVEEKIGRAAIGRARLSDRAGVDEVVGSVAEKHAIAVGRRKLGLDR